MRLILSIPEKQTVSQLHDVGLVHAGHLLASVPRRVVEGELGNAPRLLRGHHLKYSCHLILLLENYIHVLYSLGRQVRD